MISTEVEARTILPTYMTYHDTWRTKQQPPEFLRPAPKPLTQLRYNGVSSPLINGLTHHSHTSQTAPPSSNRTAPPPQCLPPPPPANLPPTPSPSPSTPTTPLSTNNNQSLRNNKFSPPILVNNNNNNNSSSSGSRSNSSSPVNLSATSHNPKGMLGDEVGVVPGMTPDELQYTAYRIFAPSFVPTAYHARPYAVYAAAAAAASSPYALLPPHHPAAPRTTPYIPTATVAPPLSPLIDPSSYTTSTNGTYLSQTNTSSTNVTHPLSISTMHPGPGGSITSGTSAKRAGSITSGTSLLRERRPPGVVLSGGGGFKIPSGKEGSLKHRILQTRPEERTGEVLDLQQKGGIAIDAGVGSNIGRKRLCATLSPPPPTLAPPQINSLSLKHNNLTSQHIPYQPIQSKPLHSLPPPTHNKQINMHHQITNHQSPIYQSISPPSSSSSPATLSPAHVPPLPMAVGGNNGVKPLVSGGSFTRGTFIQLGGGDLRRVEDMRTEDFVQSAERSPELRLAESTVVKITENRITGGATVTLTYNERRTQVTQIEVESSWEHPYFVMGASWASCKPELTYQYYGLRVSRLQVGDVLVSVTPRELPISTQNQSSNNLPKRERDITQSITPPQINSSNVNNYNSHFRSPTTSNQTYIPYLTTSNSTYQQHQQALLLRNGPAMLPANCCVGSTNTNNCTITTVTGTAMTSRPVTYAHPQALVMRSPHAHQGSGVVAQHLLPVAVVPSSGGGGRGGSRSARSMSPDSLARKRRWSAPDQLSDDEQQPINRRSKTE